MRSLDSAPSNLGQDWAVLITRTGTPPQNQAPTVSAGPDRSITLPDRASLTGTASDDGLPAGSTLSRTWSRLSGPGVVSFSAPSAASTTATFSAAGIYVLRLTASDGALSASDDVTITVAAAGVSFVTHTLINADTDLPIPGFHPLLDDAVINLALLPTRNLAIRVNVACTTGSVRMVLSGTLVRTQTENYAPYALTDNAGNFLAWTPALGTYQLTSTAWSSGNGTGTVLGVQTIEFQVIDGSAASGLPAGNG